MTDQKAPTAVQIAARSFDDQRTQAAIQRLLYALEEFIGLRGMTPEADEQVAKLDAAKDIALIWMTPANGEGGPLQALHCALLEAPELWTRFIPKEVCLVPRQYIQALADSTLHTAPIENMETVAGDILARYAHAAQKIREDREHREDRRALDALVALYDDFTEPKAKP
jgi:molybdopterin-guanine dinucleotide biosynthesis protein A